MWNYLNEITWQDQQGVKVETRQLDVSTLRLLTTSLCSNCGQKGFWRCAVWQLIIYWVNCKSVTSVYWVWVDSWTSKLCCKDFREVKRRDGRPRMVGSRTREEGWPHEGEKSLFALWLWIICHRTQPLILMRPIVWLWLEQTIYSQVEVPQLDVLLRRDPYLTDHQVDFTWQSR